MEENLDLVDLLGFDCARIILLYAKDPWQDAFDNVIAELEERSDEAAARSCIYWDSEHPDPHGILYVIKYRFDWNSL